MATYENTISILIKATDTASSVLKATGGELDGTAAKLNAIGTTSTDVGKSLTTGLSLPIAAIAAASTKMAMNFQQTMELLHTNAGVAQKDIQGMSDAILNMAGQVGSSPEALAEAMYHIASAGQGIFSTSQMLAQLKVAAEGAAVGQANLDDTTYALTSTLAANVKGASDYNDTMGTLLAIVGSGDMKLQDLNEVIGTGLMGTLSTFGVSLQSAGAALADFGDLGERGAAAGTRLRMMLSLMASPSQAASKILGDLGLTTGEAATATGTMNQVFAETGLTTTKLADDLRQPNGIYVAITDLQSALEQSGMTASQTDTVLAKAFGGGRTDAALLQLLDTTSRLNTKFDDINASAGNFANNWAAQQQQAKQEWNNAWDGIQSDMIRLGVTIMPQVVQVFKDLGKGVTDITNWFSSLSKGQKQFVIDAAAVLAVLGPTLVVFGTLAKSLGNILSLVKLGTGTNGLPALTGVLGKAGVAGAAAESEGALSSVAGALAGLGPAGILAGLAIGGIAVLTVDHWKGVRQAVDDVGHAISNVLGGGSSSPKPILSTAQSAAAAAAGASTDKSQTQTQTGLLQTLTKQTADLAKAKGDLATKTDAYNAAVDKSYADYQKYGPNSKQEQKDLSTIATLSGQMADAQKKVNDAQSAVADTTKKLDTNTLALSKTSVGLKTVIDQLPVAHNNVKVAQDKVASSSVNVTQKHTDLTTAVALFGPKAADGNIDANKRIQGAQTNLVGALVDSKNKHNDLSTAVNNSKPAYETAIYWTQNHDANIRALGLDAKTTTGLIDNLNSSLAKSGGGSVVSRATSDIKQWAKDIGFANGTDFAPGGLAIVGENGPELVNLPRGSQVVPNPETQAILNGSTKNITAGSAAAGGNSTVNLTVNVGTFTGNQSDLQALAKKMWQAFQSIARQHGMASNLPPIGVLPS